jgi:hypothetical protein
VEGGPIAVRLGLIAAAYHYDWAQRQTYRHLRGRDHLQHPQHPDLHSQQVDGTAG